jgi:hypothetical protein
MVNDFIIMSKASNWHKKNLDPSYHIKNEVIRGGTPKEKRSTEQ